MPEVGELLGAKYRVLSLLGSGGMGSVYRAENVLTGKHVALKWMHPQYATSPDAAERLIREARAASKLSHPNVVDVYDVIRDDQALFLVMELLQGESLRDFLRKPQARPPLYELISLLLGAMSGVAAAHAQGVIHRDLKPDNIFLVRVAGLPDPIPKVLDFGIAKLVEHAEVPAATLTQTGTAIGTPVYMSFEQLRGDKNIDLRTDVYAFGVMLYEVAAGHPPFAAATLSELAIKVATTEAAPLKALRPDAPSALCAIIDRAIKRDRAARWPDVPTMMQQLAPFAQAASFRERMTFQDMTAPRMAEPRQVSARPAPVDPTDAPWTSTAPLPHTPPATFIPVATPPASHEPADSLTARELARGERPAASTLPVWVAAAAVLAVSLIAAVLLLRDSSQSKPTGVAKPQETSSSAASTARPSPPPALGSQSQPTSAASSGLEIEALQPQPQPPEPDKAELPRQPWERLPQLERPKAVQPLNAHGDAADDAQHRGSSKRRPRRTARTHEPTQQEPATPAPSSPAPDTDPVQTSPKSAAELLGF